MRTYFFRGKRVDDGEWIYGCLTRYSENIAMITTNLVDGEVYIVDPETVGQMINKTDAKGNDLYEDDVVKYSRYHGNYIMDRVDKKVVSMFSLRCDSTIGDIELIGNIHDNPEYKGQQ